MSWRKKKFQVDEEKKYGKVSVDSASSDKIKMRAMDLVLKAQRNGIMSGLIEIIIGSLLIAFNFDNKVQMHDLSTVYAKLGGFNGSIGALLILLGGITILISVRINLKIENTKIKYKD